MRAQQYESLHSWYFFSCCAFLLTLIVLISTNIYQSITVLSAAKQKNLLIAQKITIAALQQSINSLQEQEKKYQQQLTLLSSYESSCTKTHSLLNLLSQTIPADVVLTRCSFQHNRPLQLEGNAQQLKSITHFVNNLQSNNMLKLPIIDSLNQTLDSEKNSSLLHFKLVASLN